MHARIPTSTVAASPGESGALIRKQPGSASVTIAGEPSSPDDGVMSSAATRTSVTSAANGALNSACPNALTAVCTRVRARLTAAAARRHAASSATLCGVSRPA